MTTAVKRRTHQRAPLQIKRLLHESHMASESTKPEVDWEAGIIRGVKILGRTSPNCHGIDGIDGTEYTTEAMEAARPLYEGRLVNIDHPPRKEPTKDRSSYDRFGKLVNVRVEEGGLFGDLHFLKTHPMARRVCEAADKMPDLFGLSHNAYGKGEVRDKKYVITSIPEVRSVDLVADAGSVKSLFESTEQRKPMKIKEYLTACLPLIESKKARKPILAKLLEMCDDDKMKKVMEEDMPPLEDGTDMPAPEAATDPDQALKDGFRAALNALVDSALAGDMDEGAAVSKFRDLLKTHGKLTAAPEAPAVTEGEEEDDEDEEKAMKESRELKQAREELAIRDLIESAELKFAKQEARKAFVKSLVPLDAGERKAMIDERKSLVESAPQSNRPRSQSSGNVRPVIESKDGKFPTNAEERKRCAAAN